jgi:hypothetical protein
MQPAEHTTLLVELHCRNKVAVQAALSTLTTLAETNGVQVAEPEVWVQRAPRGLRDRIGVWFGERRYQRVTLSEVQA